MAIFSPISYFKALKSQREMELFLNSHTNHSLGDLLKIKNALDRFRIKYLGYPKSNNFDGISSCWGSSTPNWIPGITPDFIKELPRDNRKLGCDKQYLYISDGISYKLISHNPDDCLEIKKIFPNLIDPRRDCWAYGFWSEYGSNL